MYTRRKNIKRHTRKSLLALDRLTTGICFVQSKVVKRKSKRKLTIFLLIATKVITEGILNLVILCHLGFWTRSYATVHQTSLTAVLSSRYMVAVSASVGANSKSKWKQLGRAIPHKNSLCIQNPISVFATRILFFCLQKKLQTRK